MVYDESLELVSEPLVMITESLLMPEPKRLTGLLPTWNLKNERLFTLREIKRTVQTVVISLSQRPIWV